MSSKRQSLGVAILAALVVYGVAGCSSGGNAGGGTANTPPAGGTKGKNYTIAVIPKGATHEYWKSIHAGANQAGQELGVTIDWKGPLKEDDREDQIKIVEDKTAQKVDGMVLAPLDDTALSNPVNDTIKAGIPVVIIDSGLKNVDYVSFIATDNYKAGKLGGEELVKELGGKGKVLMLRYEQGSASTDAREKGWEDAVKAAPGIQIVSDNQYGGATTESAQSASEQLIARFKTPGGIGVDGIFCPNESTAFGMMRALETNNLAGKVKFVGFDSSQPLVDGLKKGEINALVVQDPYTMGYKGVKAIVDHLNGKSVTKDDPMPANVITKANMDQPPMAKLLAPPQAD